MAQANFMGQLSRVGNESLKIIIGLKRRGWVSLMHIGNWYLVLI